MAIFQAIFSDISEADGHSSKSELEFARQFLSTRIEGFSEISNNQWEKIIEKAKNLKLEKKELMELNFTNENKVMLISYLIGIAEADGHFDSSEIRYIMIVAVCLGWTIGEIYQYLNENQLSEGLRMGFWTDKEEQKVINPENPDIYINDLPKIGDLFTPKKEFSFLAVEPHHQIKKLDWFIDHYKLPKLSHSIEKKLPEDLPTEFNDQLSKLLAKRVYASKGEQMFSLYHQIDLVEM